jgi:hypothetical protein
MLREMHREKMLWNREMMGQRMRQTSESVLFKMNESRFLRSNPMHKIPSPITKIPNDQKPQ